jgi:hypothetical protein
LEQAVPDGKTYVEFIKALPIDKLPLSLLPEVGLVLIESALTILV